jgi:hypothetical protein
MAPAHGAAGTLPSLTLPPSTSVFHLLVPARVSREALEALLELC